MQKHISYDVYDALIKLSKQLKLEGVLSGTHLITPSATRKIHDTYKTRVGLKHLDFNGFDDGYGPGTQRVVLKHPLLDPDRVVVNPFK